MNSRPVPTTTGAASCASTTAGKKQRMLFFLAGTFTVTGTALAVGVNLWFALVPTVVGANQLLMSAVGWCPVSKLLDRLLPSPASGHGTSVGREGTAVR